MNHGQRFPHCFHFSSFVLPSFISGIICRRIGRAGSARSTEPMLAYAAHSGASRWRRRRIDANEFRSGLGRLRRGEAAAAILPEAGRYSDWLTTILSKPSGTESAEAGASSRLSRSSEPLHHAVAVFASQQRSYVTADPGYEAGISAQTPSEPKVVKYPLTKDHAHDVKAMVAAAPDAGVFYVCSPNNPTGTLTSHADIEYLVENKPKGLDCAGGRGLHSFLRCAAVGHGSGAGGKDVILLRTFSKIYGMAGLRWRSIRSRRSAGKNRELCRMNACRSPRWSRLRPV